MLDASNPETWTEIPYEAAAPTTASAPDTIVHLIAAKEKGPRIGTYAPCRCWRCRDGVAVADRPILDRLLAKRLVSLPTAEAAQFMSQWRSHPRHDSQAREQLAAWLRILGPLKSQEPEPEYPIYTMPEAE